MPLYSFLTDVMPGPLKNPFPIETHYSPFSILLRHRKLLEKVTDAFFIFNGNADSKQHRLQDLFFPEERMGIVDYLGAASGVWFQLSIDLYAWVELLRRKVGRRNWATQLLAWVPFLPVLLVIFVFQMIFFALYLLLSHIRPIISGLLTLFSFPLILLIHAMSLRYSTPLHQTVFNQTEASYKTISDALRNGNALEAFITSTQEPIMAIAKSRGILSEAATHPLDTDVQRLYAAIQQEEKIDCAFTFYRLTPDSTALQILLAALKLNLGNITARLEKEGRLKLLLKTLFKQSVHHHLVAEERRLMPFDVANKIVAFM